MTALWRKRRTVLRSAWMLGLVAAIALTAQCSTGRAAGKANVVLIIIDTIRADRLGCYGYPENTSPNIDKLASQGTLFRKAVTSAPITLPSVSAMLTSTYPVSNNVRYNGRFFLDESNITLAEILKAHGYKTGAFIGGFPLDSRFKLNQGFDVYDDDFTNSSARETRNWIGHKVDDFERTAAEVNQKVFEWLGKVKTDRFFLMVHYFDPHWPHEAPDGYDGQFTNAYLAEVAYTDEQIGRLMSELERLGVDKNTLIVLTGDHGEGLGAHEELTHGEYLFDTTVLIPLIFSHQGDIPKGRTVDTMVRSIDIMPTILDFLGISDSPDSEGTSLLPAVDGELAEKPALLETMLPYYESSDLGTTPAKIFGLRTGKWKLVYATLERDGKTGWTGQLYDVEKDPLEIFNVMEENPETFTLLMDKMLTMMKGYSVQGHTKNNTIEMDVETRDKLRSLGYLK